LIDKATLVRVKAHSYLHFTNPSLTACRLSYSGGARLGLVIINYFRLQILIHFPA
jgi:hypothetical protein